MIPALIVAWIAVGVIGWSIVRGGSRRKHKEPGEKIAI